MADSDSDGDDNDDDGGLQEDILMDKSGQPAAERPKKKAHRKDEKYIHEDADTIVDLADIKAMSSIGCKLNHKSGVSKAYNQNFCPFLSIS